MKRKMYLRKNIFNISIFAFLLQAGGEEGKEKNPNQWIVFFQVMY